MNPITLIFHNKFLEQKYKTHKSLQLAPFYKTLYVSFLSLEILFFIKDHNQTEKSYSQYTEIHQIIYLSSTIIFYLASILLFHFLPQHSHIYLLILQPIIVFSNTNLIANIDKNKNLFTN